MSDIETLRRKNDFLQHDAPQWAREVWPRPQSLTWFIKNNRARLLADGAVVRVGRDYFIVIDKFLTVAPAILGLPARQGVSS